MNLIEVKMKENEDKTKAARLAGYSDNRDANDFYETPIKDVVKFANIFIKDYPNLGNFLEPSAGGGNIIKGFQQADNSSQAVKSFITNDIIQRDYPLDYNKDYLAMTRDDFDKPIDTIITNPPYKFAREFIEKSFELLDNPHNGVVVMLLRLQFLEGIGRKTFLEKHLKEVYVSSSRVNCRSEEMQLAGKKASSTLAMGWFVFQAVKDPQRNAIIKFI